MNTRSFIDPSKRTSRINSSTPKSQHAGSHQPQKRWQPKPKKAANPQAAGSQFSPNEHDMFIRQQALSLAQQGSMAEAVALFSELLIRNPESAIDHSNRGLIYAQSGLFEEAIADYNRAIELNPRLDSAYNNRANYYAAQGQYLEAILDYDVALDLNPANVRAWINQGITFRDLEMYDRALESFELALCLGRLEGHIFAERGRTYHLRGDWNCAIADYQRSLDKLSQSATSAQGSAARLCLQVEGWTNELLSSAFEKDDAWKV
ncbi:MAG TPA: tetratricopeptide repeat protein [Coleofasciculaceae cyanobacterium]|jgi:Flp pilus assembly protein TadD